MKVFIIIDEPIMKKGTPKFLLTVWLLPYAQMTGRYVENNTHEDVHFRVSMKHNVEDILKDELNEYDNK